MALFAAPIRTEVSDTTPNPNNGVARAGIGKLWDWATSLLGTTGATGAMLAASKILDGKAYYNLSLVPSVAGNALTMTLKASDGATALATDNSGTIGQRSATVASGLAIVRSITAPVSTVISSGSTAGHTSTVAGYIYWYIIDNAGAQELAWSSTDYGLSGIVSTTAEGGAGAADSALLMYSTTARANVAFRCIGRSLDVQTVAGTWTAVPLFIEMAPFNLGIGIHRGKISGLIQAINVGDAVNDTDISPGCAIDSNNVELMELVSTLTKRLDANFAVGTNQGGLDTGAKANSTWYYIHEIKRGDTGVVDAIYSLSATAPTMPANYHFRRLIGAVHTDGAGAIEAYHAYELPGGAIEIAWDSPTPDINLLNTLTTARRLDTLRVPTQISTLAYVTQRLVDATLGYTWSFTNPDVVDGAPVSNAAPGIGLGWQNNQVGIVLSPSMYVRTSATGQVAARGSIATIDGYIVFTNAFQMGRV